MDERDCFTFAVSFSARVEAVNYHCSQFLVSVWSEFTCAVVFRVMTSCKNCKKKLCICR